MATRVVGGVAIDYIARTGKFTAGTNRVRSELRSIKSSFADSAVAVAEWGLKFAAVAGGALMYFWNQERKVIDALGKTSDRLGISTEALAAFEFAGKHAGVEIHAITTGLQYMSRNIGEAIQGNKAMIVTFARLGISVAQLKLMAPEQQYEAISDSIKRLRSESERTAAIMDIFGRGGAEMTNVILQGKRGFEDAQKAAKNYGLALSRDAVKGVEDMNDAFEDLKQILEGTKRYLVSEFAPTAKAVFQWINPYSPQGWVQASNRAKQAALVDNAQRLGAALQELYGRRSTQNVDALLGAQNLVQRSGQGNSLAGLISPGSTMVGARDWFLNADPAALMAEARKQSTDALKETQQQVIGIRQETLAALGDIGMTEVEQMRTRATQEIELVNWAEGLKVIAAEDAEKRRTAITRRETARRAQMYIADAQFIIGGLSEIAANAEMSAKEQFRVTKALKIAETICNTAAAVMRYHSEGRTAMAWTAGTLGAAQVAAIASTQFEGGGTVAPSAGGAESIPGLTENSGISRRPQNLTVVVEGGNRRWTREEVVDMLQNFGDLISDGYHLNVSGG